ncbi:hypothetical protein MUN82_08945 [Hymenobacter aerilatus]|uniref:Uncharacterized protein n=1 Tax=Hymenobacter aerilatus TaxID=2932251 RepID=A0A8T9T3N3_9BACT|nr:hypothetical protein [Hymenobacter aerilatus]UOR07210.1 hypothetical protein MUN82_08945 [Hymenobacter aerilatus]
MDTKTYYNDKTKEVVAVTSNPMYAYRKAVQQGVLELSSKDGRGRLYDNTEDYKRHVAGGCPTSL